MTKVKSRQFIGSSCTSISTASIFILLAGISSCPLPAQAGPQSMLDPYADIQPTASQPEKKPARTKKSPTQKDSAQQQSASNDLGNRTSSKNPSSANKQASNPGFLSGIKEVQHGTVTSFKAAGHGIVNGTKAAGSKIAGGAKGLGGKFKNGEPGDKLASTTDTKSDKVPKHKAKKKVRPQIATANPNIDPSVASMPELPGKPLGSLEDTLPHSKRKNPVKQKNVIARTFDKLNPFAKNKKQGAINISATDHQKGVNQ